MTEQTRSNGTLRHLLTLEGMTRQQIEALLSRAQRFVRPIGEAPAHNKSLAGITVANMGYRARVRVKLYRPVRWEENTDRFTRARFNFNGQGWGRPLVLRLH